MKKACGKGLLKRIVCVILSAAVVLSCCVFSLSKFGHRPLWYLYTFLVQDISYRSYNRTGMQGGENAEIHYVPEEDREELLQALRSVCVEGELKIYSMPYNSGYCGEAGICFNIQLPFGIVIRTDSVSLGFAVNRKLYVRDSDYTDEYNKLLKFSSKYEKSRS